MALSARLNIARTAELRAQKKAPRAVAAPLCVASAVDGARKAAAALALAGVLSFGDVSDASARTVEPYAGLTPCGKP
jgi:hypothetical protein